MTGEHDTHVAVDVGTSAVRAAVVRAGAGVLRSVRVEREGSGAGDVFDADALLREVLQALAAVECERPRSLTVSAHIGAVAVDESLRPVVAAGGWADDRGVAELAASDPDWLAEVLAGSRRPAAAPSALALALHLRRTGELDRVRALLSPKDFLVAHLTGRLVTDSVDAAYTLAADVATGDWASGLLAAAGIDPSLLPERRSPTDVVGGLTATAAAACGMVEGTPVVAGGPDGSVGLGILLGEDETVLGDVAGTTDVVARLTRTSDAPHPAALLNPALAPGRWTAGGPTGMTGGAVRHWRSLVGDVSQDELEAIEPGAGGLLVLTTMSGSRFPRWEAGSGGAVHGQRPGHGAAHLVRAAQEGASYVVREGLDLLDPDARTGRLPVVIAGGATRSAQAMRLRAAVFGRVLRVCDDPDVTLLGAAALGLIGSGDASGLDEARSQLGVSFTSVEPDERAAERYDELFEAWRSGVAG